MPAVDGEVETAVVTPCPEPPTLSGPIVGIIYPPPEVRSILNLKKKLYFYTFTLIYSNLKGFLQFSLNLSKKVAFLNPKT